MRSPDGSDVVCDCADCGKDVETSDYADLSAIRFRRHLCKACFVRVKEATKAETAIVNGEGAPSMNDWLLKRQKDHAQGRARAAAAELAGERERIAKTGKFFP